MIRETARNADLVRTPRSVFTWSVTDGLVGPSAPAKETCEAPLDALAFVARYTEPGVFVFKDFHVFFGNDKREQDYTVVRKLRDLSTLLKNSPKPKNVVFLSPAVKLPVELEKEITILEFDLPGVAEVRELLRGMIESNKRSGRLAVSLEEADIDRFAHAALGLTLHEAENAFARAMVKDARLDAGDIETIYDEKRRRYVIIGIVDFVKSDVDIADVGGLENLKRWLKKRDKSWLAPRSSACRRPRACCSPACRAAARAWSPRRSARPGSCRCCAWTWPRVRHVHRHERENIRSALRTAEAVAPRSCGWTRSRRASPRAARATAAPRRASSPPSSPGCRRR
jgi:hypothetical protein